jgi:DNA-binding transcriptional MerR regulator
VNDVQSRYTIEQAVRRTGLSAHTLRYYERIGLMEPVDRGASGHRRYTDHDLGLADFLTCLRQTGMPIRQMQRFMELTRGGDGTIADRVTVLMAHREALAEQIALLHRHFEALTSKIDYYSGLVDEARCEPVRENA